MQFNNDMNKYKDTIIVIVTLLLGAVIILTSKLIYKGNFVVDKLGKDVEYYKAEVIEIKNEEIYDDEYLENIKIGSQDIVVRITDGDLSGQEYSIINRVSRLYNTKVEEGSKVIVGVFIQNEQISDVAIYSYNRIGTIFTLVGIFFIVVILVGGIRGVKAIVSLIFTLITVIYLMLPLMLKGINPIFAAIIIAILSVTVSMYLVTGKSKKTIAAIIATVLGVVISGVIALVFGKLAHLSGITMEDAESIMYIAEDSGLQVTGIMFAGILVASLGAVMDMAMSITSAIFEIKEITENRTTRDLFLSGINIGRDVIGTMSNTLILAFAGSSLTTLILLYASDMSSNKLLNLDIVGTEIIQGLSGSIGIVLTVPLAAITAAVIANSNKIKEK